MSRTCTSNVALQVDFTEIHFVRHLLNRLQSISDTRFLVVAEELRQGWVRKIDGFLAAVSTPVLLLWLDIQTEVIGDAHVDPVHIEPKMLNALTASCAETLRIDLRVSGESDDLEDMLFGTLQQPMAEHMIGPAAHRRIADILSRAILDME